MKNVTIQLPIKLHKDAKIAAAIADKPFKVLVAEWIQDGIDKVNAEKKG